ncbi:MAG: hypothetical protein Hens3KO_23290 [Henriciella sp.]
MKFFKTMSAIAAAATLAGVAHAEGLYVSGSVGLSTQSDSDNSGSTGAFTTGDIGDGSTIDVAAGTPYGWTTEFDNGTSFSGEFGKRYESGLRVGVELAFSEADVDTHTGVTLGGGAIGALDAAAIAGSPTPLGVTIADVVADGQGDISSTALFANVYWDFGTAGAFQPYLGAGLGYADVDVTYRPSGIGVIDDGEAKFAYQIKAGATYQFQNQWEVFGEYAYRATEDIEVNNDLFPGSLEIENQQNVFSIGARYRFGG